MRGKGKTNYIKLKLLDISPCYIIDIRNEFKHIPSFTTVRMFQYFLLDRKNIDKYLKPPTILDFNIPGQYRFCFSSKQEWATLFELMVHFRNCTIVVDEADAIFTDNLFKKLLLDVFLGSRNNNVGMIFIGKRPVLIPIFIRSQADIFTIFCIEEEWDINYLSKRVKQDFPKDVYRLERGEAIVFNSGEKPNVVIFDKFKGE